MSRAIWIAIILWLVSISSSGTSPAITESELCKGPYANHSHPTEAELAKILKAHELWIETHGKEGERANLCQADLRGANLQQANLEAILPKADLRGANLQKVSLYNANLSDADLRGADLHEANLREANLREANLQKANLRGAKLSGADLYGTDLYAANLQKAKIYTANLRRASLNAASQQEADLSHANLDEASLQDVNLHKANLRNANLQQASLVRINLQEAILDGINLHGADLAEANLHKADLSEADLHGADLRGANLAGAILSNANLALVNFEPQPGSLQQNFSLALAKNLSQLIYDKSPHGLVELREVFKKGGMRTQERQLTYAIERTRRLQNWNPSWHAPWETDTRPWLEKLASKSESLFSYVLFELPSHYGMAPGRALWGLLGLIPIFALPYWMAIKHASSRSGIWMILPEDRLASRSGKKKTVLIRPHMAKTWRECLVREFRMIRTGLYFSLLSAFHLGWREYNVGTWIARMQPREYTLRATGRARTVSGLQSLLGVYLLALWVLTYFGRPFE